MLKHHKYARLARKGDRMPWGHRMFGEGSDHEGYEVVDLQDGFILSLLRDGSIILEDPAEPAEMPPAEAPAEPAQAGEDHHAS